MSSKDPIANFESVTDFKFKNIDLLKEALTHRSYLNEVHHWPYSHNERLEFLGDAVLELIVTRQLFEEFPNAPEGKLTVLRAALVNYQTLAKSALDINLGEVIFMSRGERMDNSRAKEVILANGFESLIGAMYLDQGIPPVEKFVKRWVLNRLPEILETKSYKDAKSELQEIVQERLKVTPTYEVMEEEGPAHKRIFKVGVYFGDEFIAEGEGNSKQDAEVEAAKKALEKI